MTTPALWVNELNLPCNQIGSAPTDPLMQYTGLQYGEGQENAGRDMYCGDICYTPGIGITEIKICPNYGVVLVTKDQGDVPVIECRHEGDEPEYRGNIYENPDLLGGV